jgi:hypothetical protein
MEGGEAPRVRHTWILGLACVGLLVASPLLADDSPLVDTSAGAVFVNGKPLAGAHYLDRSGELLLPIVAIAQALGHSASYQASQHVVTVADRPYPVSIDPVEPPQAMEEGGIIYVDWRFLHGVFSTMQLGLGSKGVAISCHVAPAPKVAAAPLPEESEETVYYVNMKDRHHYYHVVGCPLLATAPDERYEVDDPHLSNVLLQRMYGSKAVQLVPCPVCLGKTAATKGSKRPKASPSTAPEASPTLPPSGSPAPPSSPGK